MFTNIAIGVCICFVVFTTMAVESFHNYMSNLKISIFFLFISAMQSAEYIIFEFMYSELMNCLADDNFIQKYNGTKRSYSI